MSEMVERVAAIIEKYRPATGNDITSLNIAHTVIAAMREPTDAMNEAGDRRLWDHKGIGDETASEVWQAMIDAALK